MKRYILIFLCVIGALAGYRLLTAEGPELAGTEDAAGDAIVAVTVPDALSSNAQIGLSAFSAKCAACHGENAGGKEGLAPPLVHEIYEPSHHGDESFQRAAAVGVRQHHWPFGNMPPVDGITRGEVAMIIAYVRELQRANGIN